MSEPPLQFRRFKRISMNPGRSDVALSTRPIGGTIAIQAFMAGYPDRPRARRLRPTDYESGGEAPGFQPAPPIVQGQESGPGQVSAQDGVEEGVSRLAHLLREVVL